MRKDLTYKLVIAIAATLLGTVTRRRYTGHRSLPQGGALVVCNHISVADPVVLAHALSRSGRLPRGLATAGLFSAPVIGRLFTAMGHIPVHRGTTHASQALEGAVAALNAGELVILYPEGGIPAGDQWVGPLKTGAARLAMTTGVPVIPTAQWGIQRVVPPRTKAPWLRTLRSIVTRPQVRVLVGEPLTLAGDPNDQDGVRAATEQIRAAMNDLLAQLRPDQRPPANAA